MGYKKCFNVNHQVITPLNIAYNTKNGSVFLWNKYQIFLYEDIGNQDNSKYFIPQFHIQQVIVFNNCLVCLDTNGNIHTSTLIFKTADLEKLTISFHPRAQRTLTILPRKDNSILTFKNEYNECSICIYQANTELHLTKKILLSLPEDDRLLKPIAADVIFTCTPLQKIDFILLKDIFQLETYYEDVSLIIFTLDKKSIFCCLISKATNVQINPLKLYTCPSKICDIKIGINNDDVDIFIGLTVGAVIKLPLLTKVPNVIYLNTALHKFEIICNKLLYTDGNTMWKAEDIFSNITFKQLNLRLVNNFICIGNLILASTFNNIIYSINEELFHNKPADSDYSPAEKVLNNMVCLDEILREVEKNKELNKKMEREKNYLTILSLSNRQDLVSSMIISKIHVYENYQEMVHEETNVVLTENLIEYFAPNTILFAIKIDMTDLKNHFEKLLNHLKSPKIHLTFESLGKIIKTTSLSVKLLSTVANIVVPIDLNKIMNQIAIHIKLTPKIPGVYDEKTQTWSILYTKTFILKSEQFIKCSNIEKPLLLQEKTFLFEDLITKIAVNDHGNLFKIKNGLKKQMDFSLYVQLPDEYSKLLKEDLFSTFLGKQQAEFLSQKFKCEDFLQSKTKLTLLVLNKNIILEIHKDDFTDNCKLKTTCEDVGIAHSLRSFFSRSFRDYQTVKETDSVLIDYKLYTITENIQKKLRDSISNNATTEQLMAILEDFNKNVICVLEI